jgi:hypothetical protein
MEDTLVLLFVTGSSGSGKTTCLSRLRDRFPDMAWYDFERDGIPLGAGTAWRQQKTEYWLQHALEDQAGGRDVGICGGCIMGEILACPSAPQLRGLAVCLLECSNVIVRADRLRARPAGGLTQEILNWAAWQRMHADDPQWRQDVIRVGSADGMRWERWARWQRGDPRWAVWVLETTHLPIEETVDRLARWVEECRRARLPNPLAAAM